MYAAAAHPRLAPTAPAAPRLTPEQMEDALRAAWPSRMARATGGAAALSLFAAAASFFRGLGAQAAAGLLLALAFAALFLAIRRKAVPRRRLAFVGLAAVALTQINLMASMLTPSPSGRLAPAALIVVALSAGALWALCIDLSVEGLAWSGVVSFAILWAPWIASAESPAAFLLAAGACLALGLRLRSISSTRLFTVYHRETVLPWAAPESIEPAAVNHTIARLRLSAALGDDDFVYARRIMPCKPTAKTADSLG